MKTFLFVYVMLFENCFFMSFFLHGEWKWVQVQKASLGTVAGSTYGAFHPDFLSAGYQACVIAYEH